MFEAGKLTETTTREAASEKGADPQVEVARKNLRIICAIRDLNYSEVARRAGLGRNALSQFLGGKSALTYPNMLKICEALDVPIGLVNGPEPISERRITCFRLLEKMTDAELLKALVAVRK